MELIKKMNISYVITCHNEGLLVKNLVEHLRKFISNDDEILILDDCSDVETIEQINQTGCKIINHDLNNNFAEHRNYALQFCKCDYVFSIDADEIPSEFLLENIKEILEANPNVELFGIPRVNTIEGLTQEAVARWGWNVSVIPGFKFPVINWQNRGDVQYRLHKRLPHLKWNRRLHETIVGSNLTCELPVEPDFALLHHKTIQRQEKQNMFYNKNFTEMENRGI